MSIDIREGEEMVRHLEEKNVTMKDYLNYSLSDDLVDGPYRPLFDYTIAGNYFLSSADKRKFNYHIEQAGIEYPESEVKAYYRTADAIDKVLRYGMGIEDRADILLVKP